MARKEKKPEIQYDNKKYLRIPLKTHVVMRDDKLMDVVTNTLPMLLKRVICFSYLKNRGHHPGASDPTKGYYPQATCQISFKPRYENTCWNWAWHARNNGNGPSRVWYFPYPYGSSRQRYNKPFGRKGVFYEIAGYKAQSIDGPTPNTIPPYNQYVVLGPAHPDKVAEEISQTLGCDVAVVDINDIDGVILGVSNKSLDKAKIKGILKDNPLGQDHEQTPMGIIREVNGQ